MCGKNHADAIHHTTGRGFKNDNSESSPLNAAPVGNGECHIGRNMKPYVKKFLELTLQYLHRQGYKLTEKDLRFLEKYKEYYIDISI